MCLECGDLGILAYAPDGETVYCEACVKGLVKALRELGAHLEADRDWLARHQAEGVDCEWEQLAYDCELAEYERLRGLLSEMRREDEDAQAVFEDVT